MNFAFFNLEPQGVAVLSLLSLVLVIAISRSATVNVGVVAIAVAWIIGHYVAGLSINAILLGFPINLLSVLVGVTLLFGQAQANGTLDRIAVFAIGLAKGRCAVLPIVLFFLTLGLAAIGPGNIGAVALMAPLAMKIAARGGISPFLMTIMVANGANAGTFSPIATTGIIANGLVRRIGLDMDPWTQVFLPSLVVQSLVALGGYMLFGGLRLWRVGTPIGQCGLDLERAPLSRAQKLTLAAIAALVIGVAVLKMDTGHLAFALAAVLALLRASDHEQAFRLVPWDAIVMVCGMSMLVALIEKTGGMELFTSLLARISTPQTIAGVLGLVAGLVSVYSSSSGVVMPSLIPLVPQLSHALGADAVALVATVNVSAHLVDVSPLSTLGAMCIANTPASANRARLFRLLLINGVVMAFVGAGLCLVFFGLLWQ